MSDELSKTVVITHDELHGIIIRNLEKAIGALQSVVSDLENYNPSKVSAPKIKACVFFLEEELKKMTLRT